LANSSRHGSRQHSVSLKLNYDELIFTISKEDIRWSNMSPRARNDMVQGVGRSVGLVDVS
jgi:hypothetical protein